MPHRRLRFGCCGGCFYSVLLLAPFTVRRIKLNVQATDTGEVQTKGKSAQKSRPLSGTFSLLSRTIQQLAPPIFLTISFSQLRGQKATAINPQFVVIRESGLQPALWANGHPFTMILIFRGIKLVMLLSSQPVSRHSEMGLNGSSGLFCCLFYSTVDYPGQKNGCAACRRSN